MSKVGGGIIYWVPLFFKDGGGKWSSPPPPPPATPFFLIHPRKLDIMEVKRPFKRFLEKILEYLKNLKTNQKCLQPLKNG